MSGFKVQPPPPPPPVIAPPGRPSCGEKFPKEKDVFCERLKPHAGGHKSQSRNRYWQAES